MSSPAATADATDASPKGGGAKKLVVIGLVALLLLGSVGGGAVWFLKKRAADAAAAEEAGEGEEGHAASHKPKHDPKAVPTFVALDMFTVNLADREAERYAQVGVTLELADAAAGDQIKNYMPAIRSNILMVLSRKTSKELLEPEGKAFLAEEILREAVRPLGYELEAPERPAPAASAASVASHGDEEEAPKPKKKKKKAENDTPVKRVHFSNFIIQ
jgi:flagellar protein FliL